jgi:2-iminobutanoate/2-iminopropanoate deaminase
MMEGSVQQQVAQCLANIRATLFEAGTSLERAVSATLIVAEDEDFAGANEEWIKRFDADPPARQGAKMPVLIPGIKVSIALIAEA